MKKISVLVCIFLLALVPAFSQHTKAKASSKTKKIIPPAKVDKIWYLSFEMTIKGKGETKKGEEDEIEAWWDIDRTYSGVVELNYPTPASIAVNKSMSPDEIMAAVKSAPVKWLHSGKGNDPNQLYLMVKVKINDKIYMKLNDKGEGGSFENTTSLIYWNGVGTAMMDNAVEFLIDKNKSSYNITIPLKFKVGEYGDKNLKIERHKSIERSAFGYGDAPTLETLPIKYEDVPLGTLQFPVVIDLLDGGTIHHPTNVPLRFVQKGNVLDSGEQEWDSGDQDIDEPLFKDFPDSQKGIMVHVYYRLKQMKPTGK